MTKRKSMHSVAQVLTPGFSRSWYEAVAVVQEVAAQLSTGMSVPSPNDLTFDESGALVFGFASESGGSPVAALGRLLDGLLDGIDAPAALRDLAKENSRDNPSHATVEGFSRALAFYERPNRSADLQALASRIRAVPATNPDSEFERLREKVAGTEETSPRKPQRRQLTQREKVMAASAVGVAVLIAIVAAARATVPSGSFGLSGTREKLAETVSSGLSKIGISGGAQTGTMGAAPAGARAQHAEAPLAERQVASTTGQRRRAADIVLPAPRRSVRPQSQSNQVHTWLEGISSPAASAPQPPLDAGQSAVLAMAVPETGDVSSQPRVFSSADIEVRPPTLLRQQLPKEPAPGVDTGYFDIIVSELGEVEQVKLISPRRLFQERMLVSAAKAWRFKPAVLNGGPVKYRVRVPIILTGLP
jgi:hypothetical protein